MSRRLPSHLSDSELRVALKAKAAGERTSTADLVAHIAVYDAHKLYLPDGFPSMLAYAVAELQLSDDAAGRRITAARVAQRFPVVLYGMDDGRLSLTTVGLLSPHLTEANARGLFQAVAGKTKAEVQRLLAARFPRPDMLAWVAEAPGSPAPGPDDPHALARVEDQGGPEAGQTMPGGVVQHALARVHSRVRPLSARSFDVQFTMGEGAHAKLCYAQELLSHQIPSGDVAAVFERALDAIIRQLEKARFAATDQPRRVPARASANPRHIPAHVMRAVWERDGGRCTFVSELGRRCAGRKFIQFDHVLEVARGGEATVEGIRLRCRAHNQYGAERTFGAEFMRHKRIAAAEARAAKATAMTAHVEEVVPFLQRLGYGNHDARSAAALCDSMADASLEDRVRAALKYFRVRGTKLAPVVVPGSAGYAAGGSVVTGA